MLNKKKYFRHFCPLGVLHSMVTLYPRDFVQRVVPMMHHAHRQFQQQSNISSKSHFKRGGVMESMNMDLHKVIVRFSLLICLGPY